MSRLLDTSSLIKDFREKRFTKGSISMITLIEFLRGVSEKKRRRVKSALEEAYEVIDLDNDVILEYCRLYDELRGKGEMIGDADLLIAASAKARKLTLVTLDKGFKRLEKLGVKVMVNEA